MHDSNICNHIESSNKKTPFYAGVNKYSNSEVLPVEWFIVLLLIFILQGVP